MVTNEIEDNNESFSLDDVGQSWNAVQADADS